MVRAQDAGLDTEMDRYVACVSQGRARNGSRTFATSNVAGAVAAVGDVVGGGLVLLLLCAMLVMVAGAGLKSPGLLHTLVLSLLWVVLVVMVLVISRAKRPCFS